MCTDDEEGGRNTHDDEKKKKMHVHNKGTYIHNWHMCGAQFKVDCCSFVLRYIYMQCIEH